MRRLFVLVLALMLSNCGSVPISSLAKLRKIDFAMTDARALRAAIQLPDSIDVRPGTAVLQVAMWRDVDGGRRQEMKEAFILEEISDAQERQLLRDAEERGKRILLYRVASADLQRISEMQAKARRWKAESPGAAIGISSRQTANPVPPPCLGTIADMPPSIAQYIGRI